MSVSDNIKIIRNLKGIAQAEVARRLEIEPSSYHRLENRGDKMTLEQVDSIAQALGVTRIELLTWGGQTTDAANSTDDGQQQKRIDELEDRLKDKQFIIDKLANDMKDVSMMANIYMDYLKADAAGYLKLGTLHYTDDDGNAISVPYNSISEEEEDRIEKELVKTEIEINSDDQQKLIKTIFSHNEYALMASFLMSTGFIEDEELINGFKEYTSNPTAWIPFYYLKKLVDANSPILRAFNKESLLPLKGKL